MNQESIDKELALIACLRDPNSREQAFSLLIRTFRDRVYWHIRKILIDPDDTDDAVQCTFIQVWKNLDRFREESRLYTWIYRIATNEALASLRKRKIRGFLRLEEAGEELSRMVDDPMRFSGNEIEKLLFKALVRLPDRQKLVFQMRYFDELKYEEISIILNTSVGALKASYHLAYKKLEKFLIAH